MKNPVSADEMILTSDGTGFIYANSEPQPNAKYSCAASVAIARKNSRSVFYLVYVSRSVYFAFRPGCLSGPCVPESDFSSSFSASWA